jgi:hypothetical protein
VAVKPPRRRRRLRSLLGVGLSNQRVCALQPSDAEASAQLLHEPVDFIVPVDVFFQSLEQ